ncbi:MAG: hypothetical protein EXX96DRAFT_590006 [Benjaminiella poitrasii]|nr:MAG: hypothetical protein EXX96DRAFT_590006 [Benjaminiella poitrasii]
MSNSNNESMDIDIAGQSPDASRRTKAHYRPYDKQDRPNRHDLTSESPSRILQLLSRLPPTQSRFEASSQRSSPFIAPTPTTQSPPPPLNFQQFTPLKPKLHGHLLQERSKPSTTLKFSSEDYHKAIDDSNRKLNISFFRRKHRHVEDADEALSPISYRSTRSFSRFDRVFESMQQETFIRAPDMDEVMSQSTQDMLSEIGSEYVLHTPERLALQRQQFFEQSIVDKGKQKEMHEHLEETRTMSPVRQRRDSIRTQQEPFVRHIRIPSEKSSVDESNLKLQPTHEFPSLAQNEEKKEEEEDHEPPVPDEETQVSINDIQDMLDDYDFYGGGDDEQEKEAVVEEAIPVEEEEGEEYNQTPIDRQASVQLTEDNESIVAEPRKKTVVPGDSFIRKKLNGTIESSRDIIPNIKVKHIFDSRLNHEKNTRVGAHHFQKITTLFFDQLVDDLLSYKNNQSEEDQDEITDKDLILLMQRQRFITDKLSLDALAHKFLPREYSELVCQSALAYNELYPTSDQEFSDIEED